MNIDLFVHGTPNGHDVFGLEDDRNSFSNLYNSSGDKLKFLIQVHKSNEKLFCYYHYLIYNNIISKEGRNGSYFGITLRFDSYCYNYMEVFRLLDNIYHDNILGKILKPIKENLQFTISSFKEEGKYLKDLEQKAINLITNNGANYEFIALNGFPASPSNTPSRSLYDYTNDALLSAVKQNGAIALSPYYPTSREINKIQQAEQQVKKLQEDVNNKIQESTNAHNREINDVKRETEQYKQILSAKENELKTRDEQINQLKQQIQVHKQQVEQLGRVKNITEVVNPLVEPIIQLAKLLRAFVPQEAKEKHHNKPKEEHPNSYSVFDSIKKSLNPFLQVVIIALLVTQLSFTYFDRNQTQQIQSGTVTLTNNNSNVATKNQPQQTLNTKESLENDHSNVRINIEPYNGTGPLEKGKKYTVTAIHGKGDGTWQVCGCEKKTTNNNDSIIIVPNGSKVAISYVVNKKVIDKRELTTEQ